LDFRENFGATPRPSRPMVTDASASKTEPLYTERFVAALASEEDIPISTWLTAVREATGQKKIRYGMKLKRLGEDVIQALSDGQLFRKRFADGKDRLVGKSGVMEMSLLAFLAKKHGYDTDRPDKGVSSVSRTIQRQVMPALEWMVAHKKKGGKLGGRQAAVAGGGPKESAKA
jgi:hypothetical protein